MKMTMINSGLKGLIIKMLTSDHSWNLMIRMNDFKVLSCYYNGMPYVSVYTIEFEATIIMIIYPMCYTIVPNRLLLFLDKHGLILLLSGNISAP